VPIAESQTNYRHLITAAGGEQQWGENQHLYQCFVSWPAESMGQKQEQKRLN